MKILRVFWLLISLLPAARGAAPAVSQGPFPAYSPEIAEKIVRYAYLKELGRAPDPSGMETYRPLIQNGQHDEAWLRAMLRASDEGRSRQEKLRRERWRLALQMSPLFAGVWTMVLVSLWAFGDGIARGLFPGAKTPPGPPQKLVLGFGGVLAVIQPLTLLTPLDGGALKVFLAGGIVATAVAALRCRRRSENPRPASPTDSGPRAGMIRIAACLIPGAFFIAVAAAASARGRVGAYDSFLYHFNAVSWINEFPAVPGLANLHIRLGTNSAWHLFAALLDNGPLDGRTAWFMPGLMCLLLLFYLLHTLVFPVAHGRKTRILAALLLPFGLVQLAGLGPNLYFDLPAQNLLAIGLLELVRWLERPPEAREPGDLLMVAVPATISFIIKPIGAPFLGLAAVLTLIGYVRCLRGGRRDWRTHAVHLFPAVVLAGWMLRNAVLSGWLLFPAPALRLPVDWAVPAATEDERHAEAIQTVKGQRLIIQAYARRPGLNHMESLEEPPGAWIPRWFRERLPTFELRRLLPLGLLGLLVGTLMRRRRQSAGPGLAPALLIAGNLVFWFHNAPDLRFGTGLFWMWFAYGGTLAFDAFPDRPPWRAVTLPIALTAGLAIIHVQLGTLPGVFRMSPWVIGRSGPLPTHRQTIANGQTPPLIVHTPDYGDQCGDAELPCTPYPRDSLLMRKAGDLRRGFRVAE